jgi:uncharacterized membrane protein
MKSVTVRSRLRAVRMTRWILDHWLFLFLALFGIFNVLPFLAPVAMHLGWKSIGDLIYLLYVPLCHQMAQRSFFLFGSQVIYAPVQLPLQLTRGLSTNMLALRQFAGDPSLGWKVAWSDRMVYMYGATWVAALVYAAFAQRRQFKRFPFWLFLLLMLPMIVDGVTHTISDFSSGLFDGFRYTNVWLVQLTGETLPRNFYMGDAMGSFNSWMWFVSGIGFGIAVVGFLIPMVDGEMRYNAHILHRKLAAVTERQAAGIGSG